MGKAWSALVMVAVLGFIPLLTQSAEAAGRPVIFYACVNAQTGVLYHFQQGKPPHCLAGDRVTSWNQAGLPGPGAVVKDAKGNTIGLVDGPVVLRTIGGVVVALRALPTGFEQGLTLLYQSSDCSGPGFLEPVAFAAQTPLASLGQVHGTTLYYPTIPPPYPQRAISSSSDGPLPASQCRGPDRSFIPPDTCCTSFPTPRSLSAPPFTTADLSGFTPPFHIEVEP